MLEAYGKTMLGPKRQAKVRLEPQDLVWSPLKPFMPPSKAKLRAPTTGLWVELSKLDKQIGEREAAEKRERKAAASAEFRGGLDGQLLEKGGDGASMRRARQAVAAAACDISDESQKVLGRHARPPELPWRFREPE